MSELRILHPELHHAISVDNAPLSPEPGPPVSVVLGIRTKLGIVSGELRIARERFTAEAVHMARNSRHFAFGVASWSAVPWIVLVCAVGLSACETQQQRISEHEDRLSAAGFIIKPANTTERQEMLRKLPADKFVRCEHGDVIHYVYADPLVCGCLYIGTQEAYNKFKANELAESLADEQQLNANTYADAAWNWGAWGPWGPDFAYGPYGW